MNFMLSLLILRFSCMLSAPEVSYWCLNEPCNHKTLENRSNLALVRCKSPLLDGLKDR